MTKEELRTQCVAISKANMDNIQNYRDFLDTMKGFMGKDFPLITRFETVLNRFEKMAEVQLKEVGNLLLCESKEPLKKIWHDVSEQPKYPCDILCSFGNGCAIVYRFGLMERENTWAEDFACNKESKWCYLSDILPIKEE